MLITAATSQVVEPLALARLLVTASFVCLLLYVTRPIETHGSGSREVVNAYMLTIGLVFGAGLIVSMGASLIWSRTSAVASFAVQMMFLRKPSEQFRNRGITESWDVIGSVVAELRRLERREMKADLEELTIEIVETWRAVRATLDPGVCLERLLGYAELEPATARTIVAAAKTKAQSDSDLVFRVLLESTADVPTRNSVSLDDLLAGFDRMRRLDANETVIPGQMRLLHLLEPAS